MDSWENPAYDAALAFHRTAALIAAVKLDVFTLIGAGVSSTDALSAKTGASPRGLRVLCDFLTVIGLLAKDGETYSLAPPGRRYLDRTSPAWIGSSVDFFSAPEMLRLVLDDPVAYVTRGGSEGLGSMAPNHPIWVRFAEAMTPIASVTAKRAAAYLSSRADRPARILDIAAGHGLYGIELAKAMPDAQVTAVDWPEVLALARRNAEAAGVADRYRLVEGSAFDVDFGRGFDLVMLANFLHHFGAEGCGVMLRKVRACLAPKGRACIVDFVPNEDRVSPPMEATFAFWMLATTPQGDAHTLGDYSAMGKDAGYSGAVAHRLRPTPETLVLLET
jgi:ubiquinone/menaquinone biosynthesis C-methylase UbiE